MAGYKEFYHYSQHDTNSFNCSWLLKVVTLFLLLLITAYPLLFLKFKVKQKYIQQRTWNHGKQQNLLQTELTEFRNDIEPEFFFKKLVQKLCPETFLNRSLIAANQIPDNSKQKLAYQNLFKEIFSRFSNFHQIEKPLFIVIGNKAMNNLEYHIAPELVNLKKSDKFRIDTNDPEFIARYIGYFTFLGSPINYLDLEIKKNWRNFARKAWGEKKLPANSKFFFKGILTSFLKKLPINGLVNNYFSDILSMQNLYLYSHVVRNKSIQGFVAIGYLENQLSFKKIKNALRSLSPNANTIRYFPANRQNAFSTSDYLTNEKNYLLKVEEFKNRNVKLGIAIKRADEAFLPKVLKACSWLLKLTLLIWFAISIQTLLFDLYFPVNLRKKLLTIFAPAILLPAIATFILFYGISQNSFSVKKNLARSQLETELNKIELSYEEAINRQVLNNVAFKYLFGKQLEKHSLKGIDLAPFQPFFNTNIENSFIYSRNGQYLRLFQGKIRNSFDRVRFSNCLLALKNLTRLEENAVTRKHLQELAFTYGLAYNVSGLFDFSEAAGSEAENIAQITNINPISRGHFYLFANSRDPELKPQVSAIMGLSSSNKFAKLVTSNPDYPLNYYYNNHPDYSTEICLGLRDSTRIIDESWLDLDIRRDNVFKNIFQKAINTKETASSEDDSSSINFHSWRYYPHKPVLLAGVTKVKEETLKELFFSTAPFFLFALMLITLFLIAEIVANLFLKPIKLLENAVSEITESGDYTIKVELNNNDEFDQLGKSFNSMTAGLLQKKHISRFVSQRLVSAIEQNQQTDLSNQAKEMTILASDIRNFTTISETHPPELVVETLNQYFTCMESCILEEGGIIDKFIGDAIIAVFLTESLENPAMSACKSALKMRAALKSFNRQLNTEITIENGVGISSGKAIAATLGKSCDRKDFTIVGNLVENAENLEALSKNCKHSKVIIDANTKQLIGDAFSTYNLKPDTGEDIFEIIKDKQE